MPEPESLTFAALDGIAFAAARGRLGAVPEFAAGELGPLIEMVQLARSGLLPPPGSAPWLHQNGTEAILHAAVGGSQRWTTPYGDGSGFLRCDVLQTEPKRWTSFQLEAHKAALAAGFASQAVSRLMGAMGEIVDNVLEHSEAAPTGFVVFGSRAGVFEFVVADDGVGVLASLRSSPEYAHLADEGDALQCALTDGESRHGKAAKRGTGFSTLFRSLVNMNASLRFRSGDHALSMQGTSPTLVTAHVARKPHASGFMTSVRCTV
ncbi:ATP-binding protein [Bradyrhizobium sp. HKCCYLRH1062]|uniref:ATP-binding protein n=1 Tax=unclassified Bradyrhizobium TaxID=2631580 RepID=UPI003EB9377C